jgi:hypothetical protein
LDGLKTEPLIGTVKDYHDDDNGNNNNNNNNNNNVYVTILSAAI